MRLYKFLLVYINYILIEEKERISEISYFLFFEEHIYIENIICIIFIKCMILCILNYYIYIYLTIYVRTQYMFLQTARMINNHTHSTYF